MAKITPESIANLKALFQDNEKALGSNFSQLIDFFNNNKVTDNGDGTFNVGTITVDASKLYDLINNSSPNILPLDNEFTGKNTFDIAPINKANGKPYITADSVPQVDLSNYPTKDQLATKADTSAIDPSVMVKRVLTADDDVLSLYPGTYWVWGTAPKNYPAGSQAWSTVVVRDSIKFRIVTITDTFNYQLANIYAGYPITWSGWQVPNSGTMATKSDVTTAVSTATANMVDSSKPTNFTAGLKSGGVDVATAADLKSIEDESWHTITGKNDTLSSYICLYRKNNEQKYVDLVLSGMLGVYMDVTDPSKEILDLSGIISAPKEAEGDIVAPNVGTSGDVSVSGTKILFNWKGNSYALYQGNRLTSVGTSLNRPFFRVTFN